MRRRIRREDGQVSTEYALLIALVALAVVGALIVVSGAAGDVWDDLRGFLS